MSPSTVAEGRTATSGCQSRSFEAGIASHQPATAAKATR